jgi:hypothetical protein
MRRAVAMVTLGVVALLPAGTVAGATILTSPR